MSPHDINVLLHHYAVRAPWPNGDTPAYQGSVRWMVNAELLHDGPDGWLATTERGNALVSMLCATPLPQASFIDPRDGRVVEEAF